MVTDVKHVREDMGTEGGSKEASRPNETLIRRLVYAKNLHLLSRGLLSVGTPYADAEAVIIMDAAVESILRTVLDQLPRPGKEPEDGRELHLGALLERATRRYSPAGGAPALICNHLEVSRLHEIRNVIQHKAVLPSREEVRAQVDAFERNIRLICTNTIRVSWDQISISALFREDIFKELYTLSERSLEQGMVEDAVYYIVACFEAARFVEQHRILGSFISWAKVEPEYALDDQKNLVGYISKVHEEVEVLKLRLDYKEYRMYAQIGPTQISPEFVVSSPYGDTTKKMHDFWKGSIGSSVRTLILGDDLRGQKETKELSEWLKFAYVFVAESILKWQQLWRWGFAEDTLKTWNRNALGGYSGH